MQEEIMKRKKYYLSNRVIATDGYEVEFELQEVLNDDRMLLIREGDMLRLIAGNYDGGYWVKFVSRMIVE